MATGEIFKTHKSWGEKEKFIPSKKKTLKTSGKTKIFRHTKFEVFHSPGLNFQKKKGKDSPPDRRNIIPNENLVH